MENPFKELVSQFAENLKKAPGWVPLLILCYAAFALWLEEVSVFGFSLKAHKEAIVTVGTALLYMLGDALDKPLFKRLAPKWLDPYRRKPEEAFSLKDGIYKVSKAIAVAAKKYDGSWIQVKNEASKLFRSLVVPSVGVCLWLLSYSHVCASLLALAAGAAFLFLYVWLKASHMADLYALSKGLAIEEKYAAYDLTEKVRLFFWEGELVASAGRPLPKTDC